MKTEKTMAEAKEVKKEVKQILIEPVYGPMVHMLKDFKIEGVTKVDEVDPWLQAQVDAGKLRIVE